jgi:hypothetical protein
MALSQEKFIALWQKRIAKGRTHFIIKFALLWGGAMIVFIPLFNIIFDGNFTLEAFIAQFKTNDFYLKAVVFPLAGGILGYINWNNGIKRYKQITEAEND